MSEIKGTATLHGVTAEVCPGGAMTGLTLTHAALSRGATALADAIVEAVARATAQANQRTRSTLRTALATVDPAVLGLTQSAALTEHAESTVPDTWRLR